MLLSRHRAWIVLILLIASFLRLHDLPHVPPGMTHDEADHGLDAWGVVQGERPIYFTVGYGREPLYDYSTAVLMTFMGPSFLAGRLTSVFFSLILIAGSYSWLRRAFGHHVALLSAAGLALGFWPLMTARQALRSGTLPALLVVAVAIYWKGLRARRLETGDWRLATENWGLDDNKRPISNLQSLISSLQSPFLWSGIVLGLTFYTYIPSRVLWLLFPGLALYLWLQGRRGVWRGTLLALGVAGLVGLPLFSYLMANPGAETRIGQLALPLRQAAQGEFELLWRNARSGLGIFTVTGDLQWRYNMAGKPLFSPVGGALFYAGVLYSTWRALSGLRGRRRGADAAAGYFLNLLWLALGLAPVLITGRELSTTQAIGMQPVLYVFPALVLVRASEGVTTWLQGRRPALAPLLLPTVALFLGVALLASTWRSYFGTWAQHPDVAVQYEADLVAMVRTLDETVSDNTPVAVSTDAPGRFHDPATARLYMDDERRPLQWFDGRNSLLLPGGEEPLILISEAAPLHPGLAPYLEALQATPVDLEPAAAAYRVSHSPGRLLQFYPQLSTEINSLSTELSTDLLFGDVVHFLGYELQTAIVRAGETVRLATVWRVTAAPEEELVFFTHVLDDAGVPLAQADRLDVPAHTWRSGDVFIQLHELTLPPELTPGEYSLTVGIYRAADWRERLAVTVDGREVGDVLQLAPLVVSE